MQIPDRTNLLEKSARSEPPICLTQTLIRIELDWYFENVQVFESRHGFYFLFIFCWVTNRLVRSLQSPLIVSRPYLSLSLSHTHTHTHLDFPLNTLSYFQLSHPSLSNPSPRRHSDQPDSPLLEDSMCSSCSLASFTLENLSISPFSLSKISQSYGWIVPCVDFGWFYLNIFVG